jgi:hypothetical protein
MEKAAVCGRMARRACGRCGWTGACVRPFGLNSEWHGLFRAWTASAWLGRVGCKGPSATWLPATRGALVQARLGWAARRRHVTGDTWPVTRPRPSTLRRAAAGRAPLRLAASRARLTRPLRDWQAGTARLATGHVTRPDLLPHPLQALPSVRRAPPGPTAGRAVRAAAARSPARGPADGWSERAVVT